MEPTKVVEYIDRITVLSQLPEFEGVSFTILRISQGRRAAIRRRLSKCLEAIREKTELITTLIDESGLSQEPTKIEQSVVELPEAGAAASNPVTGLTSRQEILLGRITDINMDIETIKEGDIDPIYLESAFISINGFTMDGAIPDWKTLFERGPEELCGEIVTAIKKEAGLTFEAQVNLKSPTTSGAAAGGLTTDMTVPVAKNSDGGESEIVGATSRESSTKS